MDHLPTIHFQVLCLLLSGMYSYSSLPTFTAFGGLEKTSIFWARHWGYYWRTCWWPNWKDPTWTSPFNRGVWETRDSSRFMGFSKKTTETWKDTWLWKNLQIIDTCLKAKFVYQCESQTNRESQVIHGKSNISSSKSRLIPTLRGQKVAITIPRGMKFSCWKQHSFVKANDIK